MRFMHEGETTHGNLLFSSFSAAPPDGGQLM
jgi:hypothetical protein